MKKAKHEKENEGTNRIENGWKKERMISNRKKRRKL